MGTSTYKYVKTSTKPRGSKLRVFYHPPLQRFREKETKNRNTDPELDRGLKDTKVQRKVKLALWTLSIKPVCVPVKPLSEKYNGVV